jgi:cytoskeleton protein RodZ
MPCFVMVGARIEHGLKMAQVTRLTLDNTGDLDRRRMQYREIADDADAPLASVGEDLRKARERRGEDLDHIARVLKIRQDYLAAVEEGTMEALPGKTYAMGFVRSYAAYLGLDGNQYVGRLKAEIAGRDDTEPPPTVTSPAERRWPQGGWIAGGLLFVALIYAGYLMLSAPETEQPVIPVPDRLAVEAGLPTAQQTPTPAASAPAAKSPAAAPPPAAGPTSAPEAKAPAPATQPTPAPAPQASAPAAPAPAVSPAARTTPLVIASPLPQGRRYGVQNTNARITLRVHREAHVTVRGADSRMFINRTLQPGDTYLVPNLGGLRLSAPDAGAVELLLDGSSVGFAGQNGVANDLPLSVQAVLERLNPG